jgi:hypothetical protein
MLIVSSCANQKTEENTVTQTFASFTKSIWVSTDYIEKISATRSPLKASDKLLGIAEMHFGGQINGDSLNVAASWNNHEGTNFTLYFTKGHPPNSLKISLPDYDLKTNFYEIAYEAKQNDTTLLLKHYDKTNVLLDSKRFTKVNNTHTSDDLGWGIQQVVNNKIISGNYINIDGPKPSSIITFKDDGSVNGLGNFKKYSIQTDFIAGPENNLDQICFDISTDNAKCFTYQVGGESIRIYEVKEDAKQEFLLIGKLKYVLLRQ